MFETEMQMGEYGNGGPPWAREEEYGAYGQGEEEYPGYGQGEEEYGGYGQGEEEWPGQGEEEYGGYGQGEEEWGEGEEEYPGQGEGEEEQFLPALIPIVGSVLGGLLGGGGKKKKQSEAEAGGYGQGEEEWGESEEEAGEAEEQFLHKILLSALGREAEYNQAPLSAEQEDEFAGQLLEVSNEEELARLLGGIVNTVGRAVQGVSGAVNSPQGRAIINAVAPLAEAALTGEAEGSLMEAEEGELDQEGEQYEAARRVVQLASAAARDVATAPPGAPAQLVGELSVIRAARSFARPLFRSALRSVVPFARRFWGGRYHGFRGGSYRYGRPSGGRYSGSYGYRRYGPPRYGPPRYRPRYGYRGGTDTPAPTAIRLPPCRRVPRPSPGRNRRRCRPGRRSPATAGSRCRSVRRLRPWSRRLRRRSRRPRRLRPRPKAVPAPRPRHPRPRRRASTAGAGAAATAATAVPGRYGRYRGSGGYGGAAATAATAATAAAVAATRTTTSSATERPSGRWSRRAGGIRADERPTRPRPGSWSRRPARC